MLTGEIGCGIVDGLFIFGGTTQTKEEDLCEKF
jgi:hypothetical protein